MLALCKVALRYRRIHPKSFSSTAAGLGAELQSGEGSVPHGSSLSSKLRKTVIVEDLSDTTVVPPDALISSSSAASDATTTVVAKQMWAFSRAVRENRHVRRTQGACVVGGAKAIQRIWREYGVQPHVVFVPNTASTVPQWCLEEALPTFLVRCSPVDIKKHLLSAEYSDGFAAEFPLLSTQVSPVSDLLVEAQVDKKEEKEDVIHTGGTKNAGDRSSNSNHNSNDHGKRMQQGRQRVRSMVVLVGLRIPSNVGTLIRAAVDMGYDSVLLVNCVDPFQEKVLRASEGAVYSPNLRIYELPDPSSCVAVLSALATIHGLLPLLAVPSQEAEPAFDVAKRLHTHNARVRRQEGGGTCGEGDRAALGPMVVLGSESQGLHELSGEWRVPFQSVTLPLPNLTVDSYNVSVAGSILCDLFAPSVGAHFSRVVEEAGDREEDLLLFGSSSSSSSNSSTREEKEAEEDDNVTHKHINT